MSSDVPKKSGQAPSSSSSHNNNHGDSPGKRQSYASRHSSAILPTRMLFSAFWMQWQILVLPWQATVYFLSLLTGAMISLSSFVGAPPPGYDEKNKLRESQRIIEHLHQREDGFRRKIKDLQGKVDGKEIEAKRLQKKLGQAKMEIGKTPPGQVGHMTDTKLDLVKNADKPSKLLIHTLFWVCGIFPVYWLLHQPTVPGLSRKFVWSLISPAALLYIFGLMGDAPRFARHFINCSSIFLTGFCFCHWLHTHC